MATYKMENGTIVKTENAKCEWEEGTNWDGSNHISVNTGSQFEHEKLYCSRKGRYWLEHWSNWQGSTPWAEWISDRRAAMWLILNDEDLPKKLEQYREDIEE